MALSTIFLDWKHPLLFSAAEKLLLSSSDGFIDLSNIIVVTPTTHSAHKFKYYLTKLLSEKNSGLVPPKIVIPEYFISDNSIQKQKASYTESLLTWLSVFENTDIETLTSLFPTQPNKENRLNWNLNVINSITNLTNSIAEAGFTISSVLNNQQETIVDDIERWFDLLKLENEYTKILETNDLTDPNLYKIISTNSPTISDEINKIIIVGVIDPLPIVINAWEKLSETISIETWIHAPESEQKSFDKWGRPIEANWSNRTIDIPNFEDNVHVVSPENIQHCFTKIFSNLTGNESNSVNLNITSIFTANNNLIPNIKEFFSKYDVMTSNPAGSEFTISKLFILIDNLYKFLLTKNYQTFANLLRTPDILNYFRYKNDNFNVALLLTSLDQLQNKYLPETLDDISYMITSESRNSSKYSIKVNLLQTVYDDFLEFIEEAESELLSNFIHNFIEKIYNKRAFKSNNINDSQFIDTLTTFNKVLNEFNESKIKINHLSITKQFNIFLNILKREKTYPESKLDGTLEIHGWLETQWTGSENIIITGMNDKYLPEGIQSDLFLPDSIKQKLGIRNINSRFCRDSYLLTALLKSHNPEKIHFIVNNFDTSGDPLKPSRLLFLTDGQKLISRLNKLFSYTDEKSLSNTINDYSPSFTLKPAQKNIEPVLYATDFRNYLSSPFIFYLKKALRMEKIDDRQNDIEPSYFGDMCHAILQKFSEEINLNKIKSLCDLQNILNEYTEKEIITRYGKNLSLPSIISTTSIKQRIIKSADQLLEDHQSGWRTIEIEKAFSLTIDNHFIKKWSDNTIELKESYIIKGKIDRIDKNIKTEEVRIIDYKTAEKAKQPDKVHFKAPRNIDKYSEYSKFSLEGKSYYWLDLQLPIYYLMLKNSGIDVGSNLICSYFNLPKIIAETGISSWDNIESFIPSACSTIANIVINIEKKNFWPPYDLTGFNDIYNEFLFKSPDRTIDTNYMLNLASTE
ncbi:MAG: PD-(D/E)XK nuclease family protein [bacterium]|nr:PD-(D/E)XK nuclease family protein [bacterium]